MEEAQQAIVGAVDRAPDQYRDVGRAKKAKPRELAHDLYVVLGKTEGRRFRRTAEPGSSCRLLNSGDIHAPIISAYRHGKPGPTGVRP